MGVWLRRLAGTTAATIVASTALVLSTPAQACACGAFLLPEDAEVEVSDESAVISWDGEEERILLSLDVDAPGDDAALLIPTPSPATVDVAEPGMFEEVAEFTAPRVREVDLWWPEWLVREDLGNEGIVREEGPAPAPAPLEGIDAHVIDAADAGKLETWLEKNDYVIRDDVASALVPYAQQDWHFLLVKLEADALSGRMQPLDIRFETNQLVYPTRLSVAGGPVRIRTYVFAEHRMERSDSMGGQLTWAGPVAQTDFAEQTLVDLAGEHAFLSAWEQFFSDPRNQIDGDMVFAASSTDTPYEQVYTEVVRHEIFGAPAGPTLVFGALIIVGFGGGIYSRVRRNHRHRAEQG